MLPVSVCEDIRQTVCRQLTVFRENMKNPLFHVVRSTLEVKSRQRRAICYLLLLSRFVPPSFFFRVSWGRAGSSKEPVEINRVICSVHRWTALHLRAVSSSLIYKVPCGTVSGVFTTLALLSGWWEGHLACKKHHLSQELLFAGFYPGTFGGGKLPQTLEIPPPCQKSVWWLLAVIAVITLSVALQLLYSKCSVIYHKTMGYKWLSPPACMLGPASIWSFTVIMLMPLMRSNTVIVNIAKLLLHVLLVST